MAACASFQAPSPLPRNAMLTGRAKIARTPRHGGGGDGTCTACPSEKGPCSHVWHLQWRATQSLIRESTKIVSFFYPLLHITKPAFYSLSSLQKESYSPRTTEHVYICPVYQGPAQMVQAGQSLTPKKARPVTSLQPGGRGVGSTETLRLSRNAFTQKKPPGQSRSAAEVMNGVQCAERGVYEWARPAVRRGGSMPSGQRLRAWDVFSLGACLRAWDVFSLSDAAWGGLVLAWHQPDPPQADSGCTGDVVGACV